MCEQEQAVEDEGGFVRQASSLCRERRGREDECAVQREREAILCNGQKASKEEKSPGMRERERERRVGAVKSGQIGYAKLKRGVALHFPCCFSNNTPTHVIPGHFTEMHPCSACSCISGNLCGSGWWWKLETLQFCITIYLYTVFAYFIVQTANTTTFLTLAMIIR